ncbi:MAG: PqiC family protein [Boseongicola sp.]|nr:PqiC family protein [Boseongicola sp.]
MRLINLGAILLLSLGLAACSSSGEVARFAGETAAPSERIGILYTSVSVREISLPTYASAEFLVTEAADGTLVEDPDALWADDPVRDVTLGFSRALTTITRARVAPDPWPFRSVPEATVDIRVDTFVARSDGTFVATGQYFVAPEDEDQPERAVGFAISTPYLVTAGTRAIAGARSRTVTALAEHVARNGLR